MKYTLTDRLPIWCITCQRATQQTVANLKKGVCVCPSCRTPIELTPEFLAAIRQQ